MRLVDSGWLEAHRGAPGSSSTKRGCLLVCKQLDRHTHTDTHTHEVPDH